MNKPDNTDTSLITSKELLEQTGISRATLNNYIKDGIIPKPLVKGADNLNIRAKRIGYFPQDVLNRIEKIKRMKREGVSMETIIKEFSENIASNSDSRPVSGGLNLSIDDIRSPAYLVNNNFEIEWINQEAEEKIFHQNIRLIKDSAERNVFKLFAGMGLLKDKQKEHELVRYLMQFVKRGYDTTTLHSFYSGITEKEVQFLGEIYEHLKTPDGDSSQKTFISLIAPDGKTTIYNVYHIVFREGILFIHAQVDEFLQNILELLSHRGKIITELMKQRMPSLVSFCVLVADLQDSSRICAELPPEEYFDLIRDIWKCMNQIFKKYYGTYGKHVGDGMVYYFLKDKDDSYIVNSIYCAIELREKIKELNMEWKIRKGWFNDLYLNVGINEGQEFFGTISSATNIEFTALGDSVNYAGRLSDLARYGAILTTKNLITRLTTEDRNKIRFGIRRIDHDRETFIENMFSRVMDMLRLDDAKNSKFIDIATLAVTEILVTSPIGALQTLTGTSLNAACDARVGK